MFTCSVARIFGRLFLFPGHPEKRALRAVARPVQGGAVADRLPHVDAAGPGGDRRGVPVPAFAMAQMALWHVAGVLVPSM